MMIDATCNSDFRSELDNSVIAKYLYEIISDVRQKSKEMSKKEFKIYDEGIIQPLPRFNKTERCYEKKKKKLK